MALAMSGRGRVETFLGHRSNGVEIHGVSGAKEQEHLGFGDLVMSFSGPGKMGKGAKLMRETTHSTLNMFDCKHIHGKMSHRHKVHNLGIGLAEEVDVAAVSMDEVLRE